MQNRLDVATAEAVSFSLEPAGLGTRTLAALIDTGWQLLVSLIIGVTQSLMMDIMDWEFSSWTIAIMGLFTFLVWFAYFPFFEAIWAGQTPGKRRVHLRVVKVTGHPIGPVEAVLRGLLRIVDVYVLAVGFYVTIFTKKSQRLGDLVAGTVVIREVPFELPETAPESVPYQLPSSEVETIRKWRDRITPDEIDLIRRFLARRQELNPSQRNDIAYQLAGLAEKVGLRPRTYGEAETFLEDLVRICME